MFYSAFIIELRSGFLLKWVLKALKKMESDLIVFVTAQTIILLQFLFLKFLLFSYQVFYTFSSLDL